MRTTTFLILALLVISGCTSRTDGGARVRPLPNQPVTPTIPNGIPLDDGTGNQNTGAYNQAQPYGQASTTGEVQFPAYSGQGTEFPADNAAFPAYPNTPDPNSQQSTYTPPNTGSTPMIPGQNNVATATTNTYQPSQNQTGAVQSLLDEANSAVKAGQLEKAATALNRAVRLEPNNASIWYDLAQIRLHQGKYEQSEQLAKKSIDFAKSNQDLMNKNWRVISSARKARGDSAGSDEAMRNVQ
ncbi:tetratricopeptide repeat protein [Wohlfahrtiimonas larvae]|uniref:Tetratricopeptide repeat protein n=1 Tax=Wohlfahrtiimonas larvae TaxID=1157986 RepID=A0ABP9MVL6_9GAMM|nr:tetratricopeptide repeat protein [Wohlfahrtiimonas larvae]